MTENTATWEKFCVLLGKPGTGKSQVLIRTIDHAIRTDMSVLVAAPVALLAQGYNAIFLDDIDSDTLHGAFNIPIQGPHPNEINYALNKYDLIVVDEASMISSPISETMASTFNCLNTRPVVVLAGDKCQQQPLQTTDGRTTSTTSIINDHTFSSSNTVIHTLYQQFRIIDPEYAKFLDFSVSNIPCASVVESNSIFPHKHIEVICTENRDKAARIFNNQQATILGCENNTIILSLPEGQGVFVYPVTHIQNDMHITRYPFSPAYAQTIAKSQGRNIRHLIIWLDCDTVPPGTGYVDLSRVRARSSISLLQLIRAHQLNPVQL